MLTTLTAGLILNRHSEAIDAMVAKHMEKGLLGVGVAVVQNGKTAYQNNFCKDGSARPDSHYRLASVTKQFTAGVIVRLVREHRLSYEDSLGKLMPETPKHWHPVSVRQLLTHTSGIPSYTDSKSLAKVITKPTAPDGIWRFVRDTKVDFEPGQGWKYNNTGYCLLGSIIERTTKKSYYDALDHYLLRPAGMKSTGSESKFKPIASYDGEAKPSQQIHYDWPYASGALVSTVGDMIKWDFALRGTKLFTSEEKVQMFGVDPVAAKFGHSYGFGWHSRFVNGKLYTVNHTGGIPGFSTKIERSVNGTTVIVLANHEYVDRETLSSEILDHYDPAPKPVPVKDSNPALTAKHRAFVSELLKGNIDEKAFSPEFLKAVPVDVLRKTNLQLAKVGEMKSFDLLSENPGARVYAIVLGESSLSFRVVESNGVIVGMTIR